MLSASVDKLHAAIIITINYREPTYDFHHTFAYIEHDMHNTSHKLYNILYYLEIYNVYK